jgi:acetolactate synthase regulatory subunit
MKAAIRKLFRQPARFREAGRSLWLEGHPHRGPKSGSRRRHPGDDRPSRPGDGRLPGAKDANCFPMIPSGAAHTDMILYGDKVAARWTTKRRRWCEDTQRDEDQAEAERHVLDHHWSTTRPAILAKIAGLFTARGYNIDSLTVADITENHAVSRITIVTNGPPQVIDQIEAQLERLVPVHKVIDLTEAWPARRARAGAGQGGRHRRQAGRGAAPGRRLPRQGGRHHHRELRVRTDRRADKIDSSSR